MVWFFPEACTVVWGLSLGVWLSARVPVDLWQWQQEGKLPGEGANRIVWLWIRWFCWGSWSNGCAKRCDRALAWLQNCPSLWVLHLGTWPSPAPTYKGIGHLGQGAWVQMTTNFFWQTSGYHCFTGVPIFLVCFCSFWEHGGGSKLQVLTYKEAIKDLENAGEVNVKLSMHSLDKQEGSNDITFTSQKKVCFVLDQPKESKRKKVGSRVQPHLSSSSLFLFLLSQPVNPIIFHILASLLFLFYNVFKLNNVWNHFSLSSSVPRHLAQLWHLVPSLCWQSYAPLRIWKSHGGWGLWLLKKIWDPKSTKQPIIAYFKYFNLHWSFGK